jgi:hypothetical protein
MKNPQPHYLDGIVASTTGISELCGERVFPTSASDLAGSWIPESLTCVGNKLHLAISLSLFTGRSEGFARRLPRLGDRWEVHLRTRRRGSLRPSASRVLPRGPCGNLRGTDAEKGSPGGVLRTIGHGTQRVLHPAKEWRVRRVLLMSSLAVHRAQVADVRRATG